jgi:4a-hydroxytetrahydrobiopterin dehydratase
VYSTVDTVHYLARNNSHLNFKLLVTQYSHYTALIDYTASGYTIVIMANRNKRCCDEVVLDLPSIRKHLPELSNQWELVVEPIHQLKWRFTCRNWQSAISFINQCGAVAETLGHHPDISLTRYRDIEVTIFTHSLGAITQLDLALAKQLDSIAVDYSPKWLLEHPRVAGEV